MSLVWCNVRVGLPAAEQYLYDGTTLLCSTSTTAVGSARYTVLKPVYTRYASTLVRVVFRNKEGRA